jgi:hypothetical protein
MWDYVFFPRIERPSCWDCISENSYLSANTRTDWLGGLCSLKIVLTGHLWVSCLLFNTAKFCALCFCNVKYTAESVYNVCNYMGKGQSSCTTGNLFCIYKARFWTMFINTNAHWRNSLHLLEREQHVSAHVTPPCHLSLWLIVVNRRKGETTKPKNSKI